MVTTTKFIRKPLYVDAVQVTTENLAEVATWCQAQVRRSIDDNPLAEPDSSNVALERYIYVRVHNPKNVRQTKAYVGDWILYTDRGYKVYTQKAFRSSFEPVAAPPATPLEQSPAVQAREKEVSASSESTEPGANPMSEITD